MNYYCVYMLASKKNGILYIGVTNNLMRRVYERKHNLMEVSPENIIFIN
jgi:putative endonuclease